ncbi:MAG TPA: type II toxin-antitoxin system RelB/DinJ family antitoxin [Sphaerochaeta sp.]|nr:type II toxin-antitoxin system RelB/DinJ family antitoxin [Sphaerochaeta sp.]HPK46361.1 type II toxin-antitoxin system RelB/DinJ family antitoxin [Sphaerochaeta sp.]
MDTTYSFRTDKNSKEEASAILKSLGTDLSSVFNMCMRQIIIQKGIPFDVNLGYNQETIDTLNEVKERKNINGPYDTFEEMKKALHA